MLGSPCQYPASAAWGTGISSTAPPNGITDLTYYVTPEGRVVDVTLVKRSPIAADLDAAAVQCVSAWRIDPADKSPAASVGPHRGTINWLVTPGAKSNADMPPGRFIPIPQGCAGYYPPIAARLNKEGTTILEFTVRADGSARDARVLQSSGFVPLDDGAVACAKFWHFEPTTKDGKPIEATKTYSVEWRMQAPPK